MPTRWSEILRLVLYFSDNTCSEVQLNWLQLNWQNPQHKHLVPSKAAPVITDSLHLLSSTLLEHCDWACTGFHIYPSWCSHIAIGLRHPHFNQWISLSYCYCKLLQNVCKVRFRLIVFGLNTGQVKCIFCWSLYFQFSEWNNLRLDAAISITHFQLVLATHEDLF